MSSEASEGRGTCTEFTTVETWALPVPSLNIMFSLLLYLFFASTS